MAAALPTFDSCLIDECLRFSCGCCHESIRLLATRVNQRSGATQIGQFRRVFQHEKLFRHNQRERCEVGNGSTGIPSGLSMPMDASFRFITVLGEATREAKLGKTELISYGVDFPD